MVNNFDYAMSPFFQMKCLDVCNDGIRFNCSCVLLSNSRDSEPIKRVELGLRIDQCTALITSLSVMACDELELLQ